MLKKIKILISTCIILFLVGCYDYQYIEPVKLSGYFEINVDVMDNNTGASISDILLYVLDGTKKISPYMVSEKTSLHFYDESFTTTKEVTIKAVDIENGTYKNGERKLIINPDNRYYNVDIKLEKK
ncbi:MAG: hypothetical protein A2015_01440 [Spirochaetes bacterium GWF1_31_7]|nr:MAG: hypothetical protein A2Y30_08030 [Spirochaetes bacterium GWE1_32_154]OHD47856.1 MAG: hypothetical protein A2015_01440 [Spirochaetes bacterium GWF1_31_7]OHD52217.1 MAG: hypothetical protein A2Y29_17675 [Spirochaetes bacterium GWE2_31_10]OHD78881.1 MAG: hypothetical protein A2355_01280 [Spirochaetes bacterium RIFOXYB1_FULL_32_8]HBD95216.1 hypothetical protein [Spirochaetia bacterium]